MSIKTVFLDMGGTIDTFWFSPEMRLQATPGLQALLSAAGIDLHLTNEKLYGLVTTGLANYHQWRLRTLDELPSCQVWRKYILAGYPEDFPQLDPIADDLMVWIETHYYQRQMRPEIPMVLDEIQKMGFKIGLISNVNSRGQVPLNLNQYGIHHYFNPIVLSSEYGRRKPDPAIFHYAARLANSPTSECIYIGDRISRDIVGAKRAGFQLAIQIKHNFEHGERDEGATPDLIIENMADLIDILRQDNNHPKRNNLLKTTTTHEIRAILFDADGILYYRPGKGQKFNAFLKEFGVNGKNISSLEVEHLRHQAFIGRITFEQYKEAVLRMYGITEPSHICRGIEIINEEKNDVRYFDGVRETLTTLKNKKFYLGIVTDTAHPLHVKINKLERGGFGAVWDSITSSQEVGAQKPDPKIYNTALQQLGVNSSQAVFVGHKSSELEGARQVGMKTIAFNYDDTAKADFYIENFSDLINLPIIK
jgi:putative hydrolase of the HAD superfamily